MRLVLLAANKASFHPVRFNAHGPSYILGKQKQRDAKVKPDEHTYNGVGKSLLLYLVNYCLGADSKESFQRQLDGWEFFLTINLHGSDIIVTRQVAVPDKVWFGAEEISVEEYRDRLQAAVYPTAKEIKFLTFRSLIGPFLRPGKTAYNSYDGIHYSEKPVQKLLRAVYLLGLDTKLVLDKYERREEILKMTDMGTRFSKDPIIKEYFQGKKDVNLDISDLREQLAVLDNNLAEFKVADNYHEVEREANSLKSQLQKIRNQAMTLDTKLRQIDESMAAKPDVSLEAVRGMYEDVKIYFSAVLIRSLEDVEAFHNELLKARQVRLKKEKQSLQQRLAASDTRLKEIGAELDKQLRFLNAHGALGELLSLSERANELRNRMQKLIDFKEITKKYRDRTRDLKVELAAANVEATKYLDENNKLVEEVADTFRAFAKRIYPDKKSGLTIDNDEGDNQTRFKIEAKILSDASDGINEAKIFAYDMTVAALRRNHQMRFLCHDSRLFSDIDPRQRAEIFAIAHEFSNSRDLQYIATVNQDQIEPLRARFGDEKFKTIFTDCVVLELNDDTPEDRLLGIEVDLDYD